MTAMGYPVQEYDQIDQYDTKLIIKLQHLISQQQYDWDTHAQNLTYKYIANVHWYSNTILFSLPLTQQP